ncbi:unnamed protein product [Heterobilharzia americana]|nr:unnamed protein product [Heterobilharzia americana]
MLPFFKSSQEHSVENVINRIISPLKGGLLTVKLFVCILLIIILMTSSYFYLVYTDLHEEKTKFSSILENFMADKIHIALLVDGGPGLFYLDSLLKSIFYNQERFRCDLKNCCISNLCDRFTDNCPKYEERTSHVYPITLHLLTNNRSSGDLSYLMNMWKIRDLEYHFYDCSKHMDNLQWIVSKHSSGAKPFLKLLLPDILPSSVHKVIVLDIDILFNADIVELWNHFEKFQETQMIGIALEQNPHFENVMKDLIKEWEGYGYNGGILLFDLFKLRSIMWNEIWISITTYLLGIQGYLITGEQDIMNAIVFKYKDLLYEIPCQWNVQLSDGSDKFRCPVGWLSPVELRKRNYSTIVKQPKIVHINHHLKPEDKKDKRFLSTENIDRSDTVLENSELYDKFISEYFKFRLLDRACFQ